MNIAEALVLVLCFPAAGALLFTLAAIERRLTGEPAKRQRNTAQARPDDQAAPGANPGTGANPDPGANRDLGKAALRRAPGDGSRPAADRARVRAGHARRTPRPGKTGTVVHRAHTK